MHQIAAISWYFVAEGTFAKNVAPNWSQLPQDSSINQLSSRKDSLRCRLTINSSYSSMRTRKCVAEGTLRCGGDIGHLSSLCGRVKFYRLSILFFHHILSPSERRKRIELIVPPREKYRSVEVRCGGDTFLEQHLMYPKNEQITPL